MVSWCVALLVLGGCVSVGPPGASEQSAIERGEMAVLLMRWTGTVEGEPFAAAAGAGPLINRFYTSLGNLDTLAPIRGFDIQRHLTRESRETGWVYFLLPPGQHILVLRGTDRAAFDASCPAVRLEVPAGVPVIYAGHLHVDLDRGQRQLLHVPTVATSRGLRVSDEREHAFAVAAASLPQYPAPRVVLMRVYGRAPDEGAADPRPLDGLLITGGLTVDVDELRRRAAERGAAPGLAISGAALQAGGAAPNDPLGAIIVGATFVAGLAIASFGAVAGSIAGAAEEARWREHLEEAAAAVRAADLPHRIAEELQSIMPAASPGAIDVHIEPDTQVEDGLHPDRRTLVVRMLPLLLRECAERRTFCFELTARVRLWDPDEQRWAFDEYMVWTNAAAKREPSIYLRPIPHESPVLHLDELADPSAEAIVRQRLVDGARHLAQEIVHRLGRP